MNVSWGRLPGVDPASTVHRLFDRNVRGFGFGLRCGIQGNARSYGDVCLNPGGVLLKTVGLDKFIEFDDQRGVLRCESGVLLRDILALIVPRGWFLPVTPGTQLVTVGGAIANDVHGKNHHRAGTFGCHVSRLELVRSNGDRIRCSQLENPEWFAATVGGLGLTGLITWAELRLVRIQSPYIQSAEVRFGSLSEFFTLSAEAERQHAYSVAWLDCLAEKGRGILTAGDHIHDSAPLADKAASQRLTLPVALPFSLVNRTSVQLFNTGYYRRRLNNGRVHYRPFFYPLDGIGHWNRLYGHQGFYQYQCVIPQKDSLEALAEILGEISRSGQGSFLAVLKTFGKVPSPGLMSFPMPGTTLALDFPNLGAKTLLLFDRLDAIVSAAGGRLYAAKDARMSRAMFERSYPALGRFSEFIDPGINSGFWRRMTEQ